jgi:hypothetical protein
MRILATLLLILSTLSPISAKVSNQESDEKLSPKEEKEVRAFAGRFAANLQRTRDLTPYLNKPPASDWFFKAITDPKDPAGFVDNEVASKLGEVKLLSFYIALWNVAYLSETYIYGRFLLEKTAFRDLSPQQQYPPHVVRLMKRNPTLNRWWKDDDSSDSEKRVATLEQFYSLLRTYSEAADLMRLYFRRHPPERTPIYKQNLRYLEHFLKEISVDTCDSQEKCAGLPLRTQTIKVNLPVVQLVLVRLDGRLQVLIVGLHND